MGLRNTTGPFIVLSALLAACGKPAQPPASAATVPAAPLKVEPQPNLSPVPVPKDLVLMARAERLDNAATTIAGWMKLPFDLKMLDSLGPGLSQTLRADLPVEAAVVLADAGEGDVAQPYSVFSVGVTSLEAARQLFEKFERKLEQTSPGVWITVDKSPMTCAVAAAVGRAQARIVCGDRKVDVETLLPFATRGLPLQSMGTADLHIELKLAPLRDRYGSKLRQGKALAVPMALHALGLTDARLSRPLTDILYSLGDELVDVMDDLDRVVIDSRLAPSPDRVDISASFDFARAHSWTAQALADAGKRSAPAPQSLLELPRDSTLASYASAQNPKMYENLVHRLTALIDGALSHIEVNQKVRDEFSRSLDQLYAARTASGSCGAVSSESGPIAQGGKMDLLATLSPWQVCIYDQPLPASMTASLDAVAKILVDPAYRKAVDAKALSFKRTQAGAGMPAGTVAYELSLDSEAFVKSLSRMVSGNKAEPKAKAKTDTDKAVVGKAYFYVVPDGNRWFFGMGRDSKETQAHLAAIKKAPADAKLGAIPEVAYLKSTPGIAGGFFTMSYVANVVKRRKQSFNGPILDPDDALASAPHHGLTPIPMVWTVTGLPSAPKFECKFRVEKAVFEDAVAVGMQYATRMIK